MNKFFFCTIDEINKKKYYVKFIEELRDEIIAFIDNETNEIKLFSSICPHFGGEIIYDSNKDVLRCKWHNWKFCKNSGKCLSFPIKGILNPYNFEVTPQRLSRYNSKIVNKNIYIVI